MKKIISAMVVVAFLACSVVACYATDSNAWKNNIGEINLTDMTVSGEGIAVSDGDIIITSGGDFEVTGENTDAMIRINAEDKVKLRLSGIVLANADGPAIYFENTKKGFITITEGTENYISDSEEYSLDDADAALFSNDDLEIKGKGTLTITGNYKHGIAGDDDLSIENGTIIINSNEHGIKANDKIKITGGNININAETGKGIKAGLELVIDDGTFNIVSQESEGLESKGTLVINGGDINITAADDGINTGLESTNDMSTDAPQIPEKPVGEMSDDKIPQHGDFGDRNHGMGQRPNGEMPQMPEMPDGEMPQQGNLEFRDENMGQRPEGEMHGAGKPQMGDGFVGGFGLIDEETAKAHEITINGGNIYINANGDGIDSNGNLTITGGNVVIDGPEGNGDGPLDSDGTMSITGGEIILVSSAGMVQLPNDNDGNNILRVTFSKRGTEGDVITVTDGDGNDIVSHTAKKMYQSLVVISEKLKKGEEYTVNVNGETVNTVTISERTTTVGQANDFGGGRDNHGNRDNPAKEISVSVDGKTVRFETQPFIRNDSTLVGFRAILESLGAEVTWDENTRTVVAKKDNTEIILVIDSIKATVNGEEKTLLTAPEIVNGSTMIPVRFISEELGMKVDWDQENRHISVTSD